MQRNTVYGVGTGLLVGALAGYIIGHGHGMEAVQRIAGFAGPAGGALPPGMPAGMAGAPLPGGAPPGALPPSGALPTEALARIEGNRKLVQKDPKDREAWVQLGNDYFDTRQLQRSIDAYGRALELGPDDANVLTDQGVMYKDSGQFDQAIANFEKANKVDPRHAPSLFNLGVVWSHDKNDPKKAAAAWRKVMEVAPQSPQAAQARAALAELERGGKR